MTGHFRWWHCSLTHSVAPTANDSASEPVIAPRLAAASHNNEHSFRLQ